MNDRREQSEYFTIDEVRKYAASSSKGAKLDKPCSDCEGSVWNAACKLNGCIGSPYAVANLASLVPNSYQRNEAFRVDAVKQKVANFQRKLWTLFNLATIRGKHDC